MGRGRLRAAVPGSHRRDAGPGRGRPDGIAELSLTLDTETIGFLHAGTALYLAAQYQPYELAGTGTYDQEYAASTSAAVQLVAGARPAVPTTVQVTGAGHGAGREGQRR